MNAKISWVLGALAIVVVVGIFLFGRHSPARAVEEAVHRQIDLVNGRDVAGLWSEMTPTAQDACSRDAAATIAGALPEGTTGEIDVKNIAVTVDGGTATVTGSVTLDGTLVWLITPAEPVTLTRSGDRWLLADGPLVRMACARLAAGVGSIG